MKRKHRNIFRLILIAICGAVLGLNIYHLNASNLMHNKLPMPFGYGSAVVLSGSMEPEMSKGDLIIVKETENISCNNIVVFQDSDMLIVHRVIAMDGETVTTKGDANPVADQPVSKEAVKGKVVSCIPFVGSIVSLLKTPFGTVCIVIAVLLLIEIPRRRELKQADDERQKIIDEIRKIKDEMK